MKIIPKASFGNSYALIDLNVENLKTHNACSHSLESKTNEESMGH